MRFGNRTMRTFLNMASAFLGKPWIAFPVLPADGRVLFFDRDRAEFGFLSNFHPCELRIDGRDWHHVEAYYQSRKSPNPAYHDAILEKKYPSWSKYVGDSRIGDSRLSKKSWFRKHPDDLVAGWDMMRLDVMRVALEAKFQQNSNLRLALLNTDRHELIEDSPRDAFWGFGEDGRGANWLGKLLMEVRESTRGR